MNVDFFDENGREISICFFVMKVEMRNLVLFIFVMIESCFGRVICDGE